MLNKTHIYGSVDTVSGDIFTICGLKAGHYTDKENCCWNKQGVRKKTTCKNCQRIWRSRETT